MPILNNHKPKIDRFADDLLALVVPIDSVKYDPLNARLHPEKNIEAVKKSLEDFGQVKPIVVRKANRVVVAGNGTLEAARALGWTKIAATICDFSEAAAAAYGLTDNRTAELAKWDPEVIVKLEKIASAGGYEMVGWSDDDLAELHALLSEDGDLGRVESTNGEESVTLKVSISLSEEETYMEAAKRSGLPFMEWVKAALNLASKKSLVKKS